MDSVLRIGLDSTGALRQAKSFNTELGKMDKAGAAAATRADVVSRSLRGLGAAAAAYVSVSGASTIVRDLAEIQGINSRLGALTGDLAGQQRFLRETTDETSASYVVLANSYSKILPLYKAGLVTLEQSRTITKGLANVQAETGASAADLGRSMFGLSQALASPIVRAEELNQVTEAMPGLLQGLDRAAGLAGGGFRRMIVDGEVTSAFFRDTLITALAEYDGAAARLSENITQTFNRTKNAYTQAVQAFNEPISSSLLPVAEGLASAFGVIENNAEGITTAAKSAGVALGAMFVGRTAKAAAEYASALSATIKAIIATSEATAAAAAADTASAAASAKRNAVDVVRTRTTTELAAASSSLAVSSTALVQSSASLSTSNELVATTTGLATTSYSRAMVAANEYSLSLANLSRTALASRAALASPINTLPATRNAVVTEEVARIFREQGEAASNAGPKVVGYGQSAGAAGKSAKAASASVLLLGTSTQKTAASMKLAALSTVAATAKLRAHQAATLATIATTKALQGALALVGGPIGAFTIAAAGIAYLALRQSDADKSSKELTDTVDKLSEAFYTNEQSAIRAGDAALQQADKTLELLQEQLKSYKEIENFNVLGIDTRGSSIQETEEKIKKAYEERDSILAIKDAQVLLAETISGFDAQALADSSPPFDFIGKSAEQARAIIEKLVPDDAKRKKLDDYAEQLERSFNLKAITPEEFARGSAAIDEQRRKLDGLEDQALKAKRAAEELQNIVNEALPERAGINEQIRKLDLLDAAYKRGGPNVNLYSDAIEALESQIRQSEMEKRTEELREFNEAIERRVSTPFDSYRQDIGLLSQALDEMPEKAAQINLALANLDFDARAELTVVESSENATTLQRNYDKQAEALKEWHSLRNIEEGQAQQDVNALYQSYLSQREGIVRDSTDKIREFIGAQGDISLGSFVSGDSGGAAIEAAKAAALSQVNEIENAQVKADVLLAIEQEYQRQVADAVISGEATRSQIEQSSFQTRYSALIAANEQNLQIVQQFADAALGFLSQRASDEASQSLATAQADQERLSEAEAAYEASGTEQNKILLEAAQKKSETSEAAARRDFEIQKRYAIAQAIVAQGLAIAQAFADPPTSPWAKFALAASTALAVASAISTIKSSSFNGGASLSSSVSSPSSSTTSASSTSSSSDEVAQSSQNVQMVIINGAFGQKTEDEIVQDGLKRAAEQGYILDSTLSPINTQNIPTRTVTQ